MLEIVVIIIVERVGIYFCHFYQICQEIICNTFACERNMSIKMIVCCKMNNNNAFYLYSALNNAYRHFTRLQKTFSQC